MRIFAALVPPEPALEDLGDFLEPRRDAGRDLRWVDPSLWHVTLAFMAEVPAQRVDEVAEAVAAAAAARDELALSLRGAGAFPHAEDARVLWTGVGGEPSALESLAQLSRSVRLACNHAGASPEGGPFHPHLTVARSRRPFESTRWLRTLDTYEGPGWVAKEVTLFASQPGAKGRPRHYEPVATMPLGGEA
ncbi:RNA 2',3'-cyclic phosphodiesterase [Pedococcus sp. 2YAF34]|uniref:RNA 2',3'-cyclic phosphodiesterase n=1 Tax=Pedococcus sp. 2YAF34 TaxID=3233032 RepID=UPI003F96E57B